MGEQTSGAILVQLFGIEKDLNCLINKTIKVFYCGEDEIRTRGTVNPYVSLANWWFQPLTHLSGNAFLREIR